MSDEARYDEETQKFYEENKEMIDKILAQRKDDADEKNRAYFEEMARRAAFEKKARMEYEAEKLRREAFDRADKAYSDFRYGMDRTAQALEESRDRVRDYSRRQGDYLLNLIFEEMDRVRDEAYRGRQYAREHYASDMDLFRESRDRVRQKFNEGFDEVFGPVSDTQFQKHMFGAGLELWMAFNALIKSAPVPDSVKEAFTAAESNKNAEFCTKNPNCGRSESSGSDAPSSGLRSIKINKVEE